MYTSILEPRNQVKTIVIIHSYTVDTDATILFCLETDQLSVYTVPT